ncbi:hypothetical protein ACOTWI_04790 [Aliarcobacter butzleri]|jgi:hypothetical protein
MLYKDLETYFLDSKYREFIKVSLSHIENLNIETRLDKYLFIVAENFRMNKKLEFYIELNDFFEEHKNHFFSIEIRTILLISASNHILIKNYLSINKSFFIIHSVADYGLKYMDNKADHDDFLHPCINLLTLFAHKFISPLIAIFIFEHLTFTISYARKYSTDYDFVKGILLNIMSFPIIPISRKKEEITKIEVEGMPKLVDILKQHAENDIYCINFIIQLFEWCDDNSDAGHEVHFEKLFHILKEIQELTPSINFDRDIELSLMRYREYFDCHYDYMELENYYEIHGDDINFINRLRVITQLFLKLDKEKYMKVFENEISSIDPVDLRIFIEKLAPDTFSAYITSLADWNKELFFNFLEKNYHTSREIFDSTAFYIHRNDYTNIIEQNNYKFEVISSLHSNIINSINDINSLNITIKHEAHLQNTDYNINRENVPIENSREEKNLLSYLSQYYHIDDFNFDESVEYILIFQQMRVPLQQLLLKKYNKLYPFINIFDKRKINRKKVEKVIHLVLSDSSTIDQEKQIVNYISSISTDVVFEYKTIDSFHSFMEILNSDEYSVISVTTHGEVDTREPLDYKIKIGNEYINMFEIDIEYSNLNDKRLLYLNICDSGHFGLKNGLLMESLSTQLTHNSQAVVSNMWPISQSYSSTFLMIFFLQLKNTYDFKKAYQNTLLLAINNELDTFIFDNNLYKDELELFRIFCDSSMNKKSIVNWGSMVYQE